MSGPPGRVTGWGADGDSRPDECPWLHVELVLNCPPFHRVATNSGDEARGSREQGLPQLAVRATGSGQGSAPGHRGSGKPGRWGVWLGGQQAQRTEALTRGDSGEASGCRGSP